MTLGESRLDLKGRVRICGVIRVMLSPLWLLALFATLASAAASINSTATTAMLLNTTTMPKPAPTQTIKRKPCIYWQALGAKRRMQRHVIDYDAQVTLPLRIAYTDRVSHRITNAIFIYFLQDLVGYDDIEYVYLNDTISKEQSESYFNITTGAMRVMANLEVWIPPGHTDYGSSMDMLDQGAQGTGGRFGWYVWRGGMKDNSSYILDHWRSYKDENVTRLFALTPRELHEVKTIYTVNPKTGEHYCLQEQCTEGMFIPEVCKKSQCATLFAGYNKYSTFLTTQLEDQNLLVQVAWIGPNLSPDFIMTFRGENALLFFSLWPSPATVLDKILRISFPSCTEVDLWSRMNYLCKYEMYTLKKHSWKYLQTFGSFAYETISRFNLWEEDYRQLLLKYNNRTTQLGNDNPLLRSSQPNWDENIINSIACEWLNSTLKSNINEGKIRRHSDRNNITHWLPMKWADKTEIELAGIFPLDNRKFSSPGLVKAVRLAIEDIEKDTSILDNYSINLKLDNDGCSSDEVLKIFIGYFRDQERHFNSASRVVAPNLIKRLVGILGPSCSETLEPLAGVAKIFKTVIISYGAEGAFVNNEGKKGKYPYFFRTIPGNSQYKHVYFQLLKKFKWKRLASLTKEGNQYSEYLTGLHEMLHPVNIKMYHRNYLAGQDIGNSLKDLQEQRYKIIIADFYSKTACLIMCKALRRGMTAYNGYVWFLPSWFDSNWYEKECSVMEKVDCSTKDMLKALDGHMALGYAYYAPDDFQYHRNESVHDWKQRFDHFTNRYFTHMRRNYIYKSADEVNYAGYTYDAVWTYAFALDKLLKEKFTHLSNMHSNETNERFVEIIRDTNFQGVSGHIYFPEGTSRRSVVNIMQFRSNFTSETGSYKIVGNYIPNEYMKEKVKGGNGKINITLKAIEWLTKDGRQPGDGSVVGEGCVLEAFSELLGVRCEYSIVIVMLFCFSILGGILFAIFCIYRSKYERIRNENERLQRLTLDEWEISRDSIVKNRIIGSGVSGTVYGGEYIPSEESAMKAVAIKVLKNGFSFDNKLDFLYEADVMKRFDHTNVIRLVGVCTRIEPVFMVMEFMLYGDLRTYLLARRDLVPNRCSGDNDEISDFRLTSMAHDIANALNYLVQQGYIHRDVASRNCLINADRVVKLSDFGMTRIVIDSPYYVSFRKQMFPVRWMPPEAIECGKFSLQSDVWAFGVVLYEIVTFGDQPYKDIENPEVVEKIIKKRETIALPRGIRPKLEQTIQKCWQYYPEDRPDFVELMNTLSTHPRLLSPNLEVPKASGPPSEFELDASRRFSLPKKQAVLENAPNPTPERSRIERPFANSNTPPLGSPTSQEAYKMGIMNGDCNMGGFRLGKNRCCVNQAAIENGNVSSAEPLLPTTDDSYITTKYVCLHMNQRAAKSPPADSVNGDIHTPSSPQGVVA